MPRRGQRRRVGNGAATLHCGERREERRWPMPVIGYDKNWVYLVTYGEKVLQAAYGWVNKYMDESIAYLSVEMLKNGKSLEGFDLITLQKDIAAI